MITSLGIKIALEVLSKRKIRVYHYMEEFEKKTRKIFSKNILILIIIQMINVFGDNFFNLACMWMVYADSRSLFLTSVVGVVWHLSDALISPFAGVVADRYSKKKVIIATNLIAMIYSIFLFLTLSYLEYFPVWLAIISMALLNVLTSFVTPARQSIIINITEREQLDKVNGLFSSVTQASYVLSSSASGIVLAFAGISFSILLNSFSYLLVVVGFLLFNWNQVTRLTSKNIEKSSMRDDFKGGLLYLQNNKTLKNICLILLLINLTSFTGTLFSALIYENFGDQASLYGLFQSVATIGSILSGILIAGGNFKNSRITLSLSIIIFGIFLSISSFVTNVWLMFAVIFMMYISNAIVGIMLQTLVMKHLDVEYAGRVSGLVKTISISTIPLATIIAGLLGTLIRVQYIFFLAGIYTILCGLLSFQILRDIST